MVYNRLPKRDPRTVAREIPGLFDAIFPQLSPGVVAFLNRRVKTHEEQSALPDDLVQQSTLQHAMLFEIAVARAEQMIFGSEDSWAQCLELAASRQRRHFDARVPDKIEGTDIEIAEWVARNLIGILEAINTEDPKCEIIIAPEISGYQWILTGNGDFSLGNELIEVKCLSRNFGAADYRQILMYWILSYASALEKDGAEWKRGTLLNPRKNLYITIPFDELVEITAAGKYKVEVLELFSSMVGDVALNDLIEFRT